MLQCKKKTLSISRWPTTPPWEMRGPLLRKECTMPTSKVYAVRRGRATGIFTSWAECQKQTAGYPGAQFKSFTDVREALQWLNEIGRAHV